MDALRATAAAAREDRASADQAVASAEAALSAAEAETPPDPDKVAGAKAALDSAKDEAAKRTAEVETAEGELKSGEAKVVSAALAARAEAASTLRRSYLGAGAGLTALSLGIILAALYGSLIRTNGSFADLAPRSRVLVIPEKFSPQEAMNACVLDRMLSRVGVSEAGRAAVVARADACGKPSIKLRRLTNTVSALIEASIPTSSPPPPAVVSSALAALAALGVELRIGLTGKAADAPTVSPLFKVREALFHALDQVAEVRMSAAAWLAANPKIDHAVDAWQAVAAAVHGCENTTALLAELFRDLKDVPTEALKPENLGRKPPGLESLD